MTARSPLRSEAAASAMPTARCAASVQSYRALMPAHLSTHLLSACLTADRPSGAGPGHPPRHPSPPQPSPRHATGLRAREPGRDEAVPPGQVLVVARVPPAPFLGEDPVDGRALRRAMLHRNQPAGPQQPPRGVLDDPDGGQPVLAAPERTGG